MYVSIHSHPKLEYSSVGWPVGGAVAEDFWSLPSQRALPRGVSAGNLTARRQLGLRCPGNTNKQETCSPWGCFKWNCKSSLFNCSLQRVLSQTSLFVWLTLHSNVIPLKLIKIKHQICFNHYIMTPLKLTGHNNLPHFLNAGVFYWVILDMKTHQTWEWIKQGKVEHKNSMKDMYNNCNVRFWLYRSCC